MNTYYISEYSTFGTKRAATKIEARNLTVAKMIASKQRCFHGTQLEIGSAVDENGFITEPLAYKVNSGSLGRNVNNTWMDKIKFAENVGKEFAKQLNSDPSSRQNCGYLDRSEIAEGDYQAMCSVFGDDEVTQEMDDAYVAAFNDTIRLKKQID